MNYKRILILLVFCFSQLTFLQAHTITVDASIADWVGMALPTPVNLAHIARNSSNEGQYIWRDNTGDERTDFANPDGNVDITEFRTTADATNLYFMFTFSDLIIDQGNNGVVQVQIAIDRDRINGSGEPFFGSNSDTQTHADAEWEYLVITRFRTNQSPLIWQNGFGGNTSNGTVSSIHLTDNFVEISVPWAEIGGQPDASTPLRFSVISLRSSTTDDAEDSGGSGQSDVLDAVTNYGNPGATDNTWNEVSDQVVDYHFDVYFESDGDVKSPLLISEVLFDPASTGNDPHREFVEIFNNTENNIDLTTYKLGDEEVPDGGEGMRQFPSGTINAQSFVVIANDATNFNGFFGFFPDFEFSDHEAGVPDMTAFSAWASGTVSLTNSGDEVILIDEFATVVDAVTWGSGTWPNVTDGSAGDGESLERTIATIDTDDVSTGFSTIANDGNPFDPNTLSSISVMIVSTPLSETSTSSFTFQFTRTENTSLPLTINYTVGGTTTSSDYMVTTGGAGSVTFSSGSGTISFPAGSATVDLTITPEADNLVEEAETIIVSIAP